MREIARMWRASEEVMAHWEEVLPLPMHTIDYEELVARPEQEIERVLQFLDLHRDESCMRFHEQSRPVNTPSRWQVRTPLYTAAIGRWRRYEGLLPELANAFSGADSVCGSSEGESSV